MDTFDTFLTIVSTKIGFDILGIIAEAFIAWISLYIGVVYVFTNHSGKQIAIATAIYLAITVLLVAIIYVAAMLLYRFISA